MAKYDYFVIDIGSTYTKLRLFKDGRLIATAQSTTIESVYRGISLGKQKLLSALGEISIDAVHTIATSSAAGGLRMWQWDTW